MWKVPKKNISSRIADIVPLGRTRKATEESHAIKSDRVSQFAPTESDKPRIQKQRGRSLWRFVVVFLVVAVSVSGVVGYYVYHTESTRLRSVGVDVHLRSFSDFISLAKNIGKNYKNIQTLSGNGIQLLSEVRTLQNEWLHDALSGQGEALIARLERIQALIHSVTQDTDQLNTISFAASVLPIEDSSYFDASVDLRRIDTFLTDLIAWLKDDVDHHVVVFLENPAEIRPGGGFLGSYVELTVRKGAITSIVAHDINDADKELNRKVVPPKELQLIVKRFRAADANWFFDFPTSASTTLSLLESSDLYAKQGVTFDMAVGVSANAVKDLLSLTGPLTLSNGTTLTADTFLTTLQESVQNGQQQGADDPKSLLRLFAPELLAKLSTLPANGSGTLSEYIPDWIAKRDIRVYAKQSTFENFFTAYNLSGASYQLPAGFNGTYLAVVNANIGGGKSDLFVRQKVVMEAQLSEEGTVSTRLVVSRTHAASADEPWWYTAPNQSYVQVATNPSAALDYSEGGFQKTIVPRKEYATGYEVNPAIANIESTQKIQSTYPAIATLRSDGKNIFATWMRTERGDTTSLSLSYTTHLPSRLQEGSAYQFVFEKQSGVVGEYQFQINAPVGYVFTESGLPVYELKTSDPPGRLQVTLTLSKL